MIREVVGQGHTYRVEDDAVLRTDALLVAHIPYGMHTTGVGAVESLHPHTRAHIASGRWLVVTGDPAVVCPQLDTVALTLDVHVVSGGRTVVLSFTVPAGAALPFVGPDIELPGPTIAVAGLVRRLAFPRTPIANAAVTFDGPHVAGALLGLRTVLAGQHPAGTPVQARTITTGATHLLTAPADAGTSSITLDALGGLVPGSAVDLGDGEIGIIDGVDATSLQVRLRQSLQRTRAVGATVDEVTLGAPGAQTPLTRAVEPGDGVIVTAAVIAAAAIEIVDAIPARREVRATGAVTDIAGRYRLAGVRGVREASLTFAAAGFTAVGPRSHPLDPGRDPTLIDAELAV